jgi:hypothetical protein
MIPNFGDFVVSYFEMYGVELELWIKVASMHLEGATAHWFHSVERRLCHMGWNELCALVHDRFGSDEHETLIRQLFHIRQTSSVPNYVGWFSSLVDQFFTYEASANPLYYAMRFVDGLKDDIKLMVMILWPSTLDSTCAVALVQEEVEDAHRRKDFRHSEQFFSVASYKSLPGPPKFDKPLGLPIPDEG